MLPNAPGATSRNAQRNKVQGAFCSTLDTTSRNHNALGAQGRRGKQFALLEAGKVLGTRCSKLDTTSRNPARRGALGRRVREADPDSRSASERGGSAKREKPPRTRSASSGGQQPSKRQSRQKGECPGGFERTAFQDAFASFKR